MKKFNFTLGTVLSYKNQVLDSLKNEHAKILARINEQEKVIHNLEEEYRKCNNDFNQKKMEGITIIESIGFEAYLRRLEVFIQQEERKLAFIKVEEENKRNEVVVAKQDTSSLEKLKEKKLEVYHKEEQKAEEAFVEEFVSFSRIVAK